MDEVSEGYIYIYIWMQVMAMDDTSNGWVNASYGDEWMYSRVY